MNVYAQEPLARRTYWRVGGPAERLVLVHDPAELLAERPVALVLGNGSNLLVPDEGLPGTVVQLAGGFRELVPLGQAPGGEPGTTRVRAGAGLSNSVLLARLQGLGLSGLGCLAGVPGTVGGAVAMNAGTALGEVSERLLSVEGFFAHPAHGHAGGAAPAPTTLQREQLPMSYRHGGLPAGFVVTAATFSLLQGDPTGETARVATHLARRRATQPLDLPSCGSVFRNPPGDFAGRLVESVGLKGRGFGEARISERHGNFIVNAGGASATDVMRCIRLAHDTVLRETGVRLVPEVRVVGRWPPELWPLAPG